MSSIKGESNYLAEIISSLYSGVDALEKTVTDNKAAYDSAVAAFDSKDVFLEDALSSQISTYTSKVVELQNADTTNLDSLTSHITAFNTKTTDLDILDASIQSQIDSHIANYSSKVLLLDVSNSVFQEDLDEHTAEYDTKISELDTTDANLSSQLVQHIASYNTKKTELDATDANIQSQIVVHISNYTTKTTSLDTTDANIQTQIVGHIATYESETAVLDTEDIAIQSNIDSHIAVYDSKAFSLDSVDAILSSNMEEHIANYTSKMASLDGVDAVIQGEITERVTIYDVDVALLEATNASINSQIDTQIAVHNAAVSSMTNYDAFLTSMIVDNQSAYDTKMDDLELAKTALDATFASISSQVAGMDVDIINRVSDEIDTKVDQTEFDNAVGSLMAVDSALVSSLATKVTEIAQAAVDSAQNALIDSKVAQSAFDSKTESLEGLNMDWEDRFRVIEESFRTILATYKIQKPDTTFYDYNGVNQKLSSLPPVFGIIGKKYGPTANDWVFVLQFTTYGYNTLLGNVVAGISTGNITITKADIDPVTLRYDLVVAGSRSGSSFVNVTIPFEITYKNYNGTSLYTLEFTTALFNSLSLASAPAITYSSNSMDFIVNTAITAVSPTNTGGFASYSISPALPDDLNFDTATGGISGTPTTETTGSYVITATNAFGNSTFNLDIKTYIPLDILYSTNQSYVVGTIITPLSPIDNTIFDATTWSISPSLPTGLNFNTSTGAITGTPTVESSNDYTVTATNQFGSDTFSVNIKTYNVLDITYADPQNLAVGVAATINPSDNTMFDATSWSVTPALPTGLGLNVSTGVISGTPTVTVSSTTYAITATNQYGSDTYTLTLATGSKPVITYSSPQSYTQNTTIEALSPTNNGGAATSFSISPALPTGLSLNTSTGVISGTPSVESSATSYTITATNTFGSGTFSLSITVISSVSYAAGDVVWGRWINGSNVESPTDITTDSDGNIYVTGYAYSSSLQTSLLTYFNEPKTNGTADVASFIMKYNNSGIPLWGRWIDGIGSGSESNTRISLDSSGNVYIVGLSNSSTLQTSLLTYFDSLKTVDLNSFIIKYDTNGIPQWGRWISYGEDISTDSNGNIYIIGAASTEIQTSLLTYFNEIKPNNTATNIGIFIMKYDTNGTPQWGRWVDGVSDDRPCGITSDSNGNVYICGTVSTSTLQTSLLTYFNEAKSGTTTQGLFLMKYDTSGVPQWGRWIDGSGIESIKRAIKVDSSGNLYIAGCISTTSTTLQNSIVTCFNEIKVTSSPGAFVIKYNTLGIPQWGRWIDGIGTDEALGIDVDFGGSVYVTGSADNNLQAALYDYFPILKPSGSGNSGAFVLKYNPAGIPQWLKWIDSADYEVGTSIAVSSNGAVYVSGMCTKNVQSSLLTYFNEQNPDTIYSGAFIVKYESGNIPFITYNSSYKNYSQNVTIEPLTPSLTYTASSWSISPDLPTGLNFNTSTGVISGTPTVAFSPKLYTITATNSFGSGTTTLTINVRSDPLSSGDVVWGRWIDGTAADIGYGIATDSSGNVYVTGSAANVLQTSLLTYFNETKPGGSSNNGGFVVKYSSLGVPQWGRWIDGTGNADQNNGIAVDSSGNVYITGTVGTSTTTLQASLLTYFDQAKPNTTSTGGFIIKYSTLGTPLWGRWIDSANGDQNNGIAVDSNGNVYIVGTAAATLQTSLLTYFNEAKPNSNSTTGAFVIKYSTLGVPQWGRWIDGTGNDIGYGIAVDSAGNVYITGSSANVLQTSILTYFNEAKPNSSTTTGGFVVKYSSLGVPQWGRWIDGTGADVGYGIAVSSSGNVYIVGSSANTLQTSLLTYFDETKPGTTTTGGFVVKYDTLGVPQWGRWIDGTNTDIAYSIKLDSNENVYVAGGSNSIQTSLLTYFNDTKPAGLSYGGFIIKYNTLGVPQWGRWIDGNGVDENRAIAVDNNGYLYVTGAANINLQNYILEFFNESKPSTATTNNGAFIVKYVA